MHNKGYKKATLILGFIFLYCIMAVLLLKIGTDNLFFDSEKILDRLSYNYDEDQSFSFFDSYTLSAYLYKILTFSQDLNSSLLTNFRGGDFNIISYIFAVQFCTMLYIGTKLFSYAFHKNQPISFLVFTYMLFSALYLLILGLYLLPIQTIFIDRIPDPHYHNQVHP